MIKKSESKESYLKTVEFYHRLGYEEIARKKDIYDVGDDQLILARKLS
jgi:hypothetical protein